MKSLIIILAAVVGPLTGANFNGDAKAPTLVRYRIDASRSSFVVHANRTGLAWFRGHSHRIAVRDFDGEAALTLDAINPASLEMNVRAASLEESDPQFTGQQKKIIKKEMEEIVLETAKYPDISFRSTEVKGGFENGKIRVEIVGDLSLHGVTRRVEIPADVTLSGNEMRAVGEFYIERDDFDVKATSAFHGLVRVRNRLKIVFDIIAIRS